MSYRIKVLPSGHEYTAMEGESILDAALRQGYTLPYGCRSGTCASCAGRVLSGEFYYEDDFPALEDLEEGQALFCQAQPTSNLLVEAEEIEAPQQIPILNVPSKVVKKEQLCHDVMRLYLKLPEAKHPQFLAGQYLDVLMNDGTRRSFSIANAPHDSDFLELHVRHVEGGEFTHHIFYDMKPNEVWRVEIPLGNFYLREDSDRPIIMMGGGTGFAPLKGMIEHAFHTGSGRPIHLFWGVRALRDLYLADLPEQWRARHSNFRFTPVLSDPMPEDNWHGATGYVHEQVLREYPDLSGYDVYLSGPPAMVYTARDAFVEAGLAQDRVFSDAFEYNTRPSHVA